MHLLDSEGFFNFSSKPTKLNISINTISIAIILIDLQCYEIKSDGLCTCTLFVM